MHYTSIENIHKVIDPLFLDALRAELNGILEMPVPRQRNARLRAFQEKLAAPAFLDPACGSGNFLTETYLSLRRLENEAIAALIGPQSLLDLEGGEIRVKVSIAQFYGIEINDFAVSVARTALWIAESQMLAQTAVLLHRDLDFLPLKSYDNIREGNALRMDWAELLGSRGGAEARRGFDYIIGNPPFIGARWMGREQKADVLAIFGPQWPGVGDLDYVACWFKKAADLMAANPTTRTAFVATNSITQGSAPANLWKPLVTSGIAIDFAHRTFRWDSESTEKAHVHCVIVGFSTRFHSSSGSSSPALHPLYDGERPTLVPHINPYLLPASDIFVESRRKPLCDVPEIFLGGQPIDDGNLTLTAEERDALLAVEPQAAPLLRPFMMGKDFINRSPRWCLWLRDADPSLIRSCPKVRDRIAKVREFRLSSKRGSTLRAADTPALFAAPVEPSSDYIALPKVSSENRRYIPIDYLSQRVIPGDKLFVLEHATLYHFGILTSNIHMAWMRAVCGRLKSDYSYSNTIVYNNFPWPDLRASASPREKISSTAQAILDARAAHPESTLADLYDPLTMPPDLLKAHQANDRAVMTAYGFDVKMTESDCVAELFKLYERLTARA